MEVTRDIRDNDCRIVEGCLNQLIDWVCGFNFTADTARPRFVLYETAEGGKEQAERDQILAACGVRLSENYWKRTYNLSDEDIVAVSVPVSGSLEAQNRLKPPAASFAETVPATDAGMVIDTLPPDAGSLNAQGQALTAQLIAGLQQGASPEDLLDRLTTAYPEMDDTALQNELARLIFLSELVGRIEAAQELAQ